MANGNGGLNGDWKAFAAKWLLGQPAMVIQNFALLALITYGLRDISERVPQYISSVQAVHSEERKEQQQQHRDERKEASERHTERVKFLVDEFARDRDAKERWFRALSDRLGRVNAGAGVGVGADVNIETAGGG